MALTGPSDIFILFVPILALIATVMLLGSKNGSGVNPLVRILWFFFVGWWLGLIWFSLSLALMLTIIFFPIGALAVTKTWKVMTLSGSESPQDAVSDVSVDVENKISQEMTNGSNNEENSNSSEEGFEEKLQKLKDLKEDGVITEEEFKQKKEDIMDKI